MTGYGFVYCLGNQYMPDVYKVGFTAHSPLRRCSELSAGTATPSPFDLLFYIELEGAADYEREFHKRLATHRISDSREFFHCRLARIFEMFSAFAEDNSPLAMTVIGKSYLELPMPFPPVPDSMRIPVEADEHECRISFGPIYCIGG